MKKILAGGDARLVRPTFMAPVKLAGGDLEMMRWGFYRPLGPVMHKAPADKLSSYMWKPAFREKRCLIPMSGFYEFSGPPEDRQAYEISPKSREPLWAAGVWEENDVFGRCYAMIITASTAPLTAIVDRMPALLTLKEQDLFLEGELEVFGPSSIPLLIGEVANPHR